MVIASASLREHWSNPPVSRAAWSLCEHIGVTPSDDRQANPGALHGGSAPEVYLARGLPGGGRPKDSRRSLVLVC